MNGTDSPTSSAAGLEPQLKSLRFCLVLTLAFAFVMGVSLTLFLYGQHRIVKKNLTDAQKFIDEYNTNAVPTLRSLQQNLQSYGSTHPDIAPILQKYGLTNRPASGPSTGGAPMAPR